MKTISVTDLILADTLAHLKPLDLVHPKNTELLKPVLKTLGFDLDYPIQFIPSQHRNMQGKVVISYQIVGEVECNAEFLNSAWATHEDRMIAAGYRDLSLAHDLASSATIGRDYNSGEGVIEALPPDMLNPDEKSIRDQITMLEDYLRAVRGDPYKEDGGLTTIDEAYKAYLAKTAS